jgi:hypothetical protein
VRKDYSRLSAAEDVVYLTQNIVGIGEHYALRADAYNMTAAGVNLLQD